MALAASRLSAACARARAHHRSGHHVGGCDHVDGGVMSDQHNLPALTSEKAGEIMEAVIARGDIAKLDPAERAKYYTRVCESMGLNPLTKPFEYITLNGKLTLYALKTATDQLRKIYGVSVI